MPPPRKPARSPSPARRSLVPDLVSLELRTLMAVQVVPIKALANFAISNATIATFPATDLQGGLPSDFSARVDWGDNTSSTATIVAETESNPANPQAGLDYDVKSSHTYATGGQFNVVVSVQNGSSKPEFAKGVFTVDQISTTSRTIMRGVNSQAVQTIGSFTDADKNSTASQFTVKIDWGDDTSSDVKAALPGTTEGIVPHPDNGQNSFDINASHAYAVAKSYAISFNIKRSDLINAATGTSTATVVAPSPPPLVGRTIFPIAGVPLDPATTVVASFPTAEFNDTEPTHYQATIDWGDTHVTLGRVVSDPNSPTQFLVTGSNVYTSPGHFRSR